MARNISMAVATMGAGLWHSPDGGDTWNRAAGIWGDSRVFVVTAHPDDPSVVFAGTDEGIFRSDDRGKSFKKIESQMDSLEVWRIAFDPTNPDNIFTGTSPSALFRSRDGGTKWEKLPVDMAETCPNVRVPRVTALVVDPADPNIVWAGVEVDGVRRSLDGGDTWSRINGGLTDPDIHGIAVSTGSPKTVLTSTPGEIFSSTDAGESWQGLGVRKHFEFPYCREITVKKNDPNVLFVAAGEGPFGSTGNIQRSKDRGQTWEAVPLPVEPNTPIWAFSGHAADPDFMMACSHYGELYTTSNGGDSWDKLRKEFTEVRSIAWTPN